MIHEYQNWRKETLANFERLYSEWVHSPNRAHKTPPGRPDVSAGAYLEAERNSRSKTRKGNLIMPDTNKDFWMQIRLERTVAFWSAAARRYFKETN